MKYAVCLGDFVTFSLSFHFFLVMRGRPHESI
jgi:hypothetical protein